MAKKYYNSKAAAVSCDESQDCNLPQGIKMVKVGNMNNLESVPYPDTMQGMDMAFNEDLSKLNSKKHPKK